MPINKLSDLSVLGYPNPSEYHICRSLALTQVTHLLFDALCMCFVLHCTFPLAIEQDGADGLTLKFAKFKATQLGRHGARLPTEYSRFPTRSPTAYST